MIKGGGIISDIWGPMGRGNMWALTYLCFTVRSDLVLEDGVRRSHRRKLHLAITVLEMRKDALRHGPLVTSVRSCLDVSV